MRFCIHLFSGIIDFISFLDLLDVVGILYKNVGFYQFDQIPTFMRSPRAGMHTKRSALTSWYERNESNSFL